MLPDVIIHNAVSLDGRTLGFEPNLELFYSLAADWQEDMTLAGSETIVTALAGSAEGGNNGAGNDSEDAQDRWLAVVDSRGRIGDWSLLKRGGFWGRFLSLASTRTDRAHIDQLRSQGVESYVAGDSHVDLRAALEWAAAEHDIELVRVESGGVLNTVLLAEGLVTEISLLVHPVIAGDAHPAWVSAVPANVDLRLEALDALEDNYVWLRYRVE